MLIIFHLDGFFHYKIVKCNKCLVILFILYIFNMNNMLNLYTTNNLLENNYDICCNSYDQIMNDRSKKIIEHTCKFNNNPNLRPWTRINVNSGASSRNEKLSAGNRFTTIFPSNCDNYICNENNSSICNVNSNTNLNNINMCENKSNISLNQTLLNKKAYMFTNSNNKNVISGPITYRNANGISSSLQFGGTSGAGLTQSIKLANLGKGKTPEGRISRQLGVQKYIGIQLFSDSNILNKSTPTQNVNGKYIIPFCRNRR